MTMLISPLCRRRSSSLCSLTTCLRTVINVLCALLEHLCILGHPGWENQSHPPWLLVLELDTLALTVSVISFWIWPMNCLTMSGKTILIVWSILFSISLSKFSSFWGWSIWLSFPSHFPLLTPFTTTFAASRHVGQAQNTSSLSMAALLPTVSPLLNCVDWKQKRRSQKLQFVSLWLFLIATKSTLHDLHEICPPFAPQCRRNLSSLVVIWICHVGAIFVSIVTVGGRSYLWSCSCTAITYLSTVGAECCFVSSGYCWNARLLRNRKKYVLTVNGTEGHLCKKFIFISLNNWILNFKISFLICLPSHYQNQL